MAASMVPESACSHDNEIRVQDCVPTCSQETKQWLSGLVKHKINSTTSNQNIDPETSNRNINPTTSVKIQKVPQIIRDMKGNDSYDPLVVSIGPYHHGNPKLELMEQHKCRMASNFAKDDQRTLEEAYAQVMALAKSTRKCYEDDEEGTVAKFEDEEFTKMMFLDGCFVVQFIYCCTRKRDGKQDGDQPNSTSLGMKGHIAAWVRRDLFLLENQLPFKVLEKLMTFKLRGEGKWRKMLDDFIENILLGPQHNYSKQPQDKRKQDHQQNTVINVENDPEPAHLLAYTRTKLIGKQRNGGVGCSFWSSFRSAMEFISEKISFKTRKSDQPSSWSSYRSAMELKLAGINFKPNKSRELRSVEFRECFLTDELYLPNMTVDDSTKSLLLNMVAYETCADSPDDFVVTSYICFLDSLIDHAEDVKELRSRSIVHNFLGSDEQVAELFNTIADNLVPNDEIYADIRQKIEKHYKNTTMKWAAEFCHTHFTSPWTILAFLGAIFALALSVIQTYEAVFPPVDTDNNDSQLNHPH